MILSADQTQCTNLYYSLTEKEKQALVLVNDLLGRLLGCVHSNSNLDMNNPDDILYLFTDIFRDQYMYTPEDRFIIQNMLLSIITHEKTNIAIPFYHDLREITERGGC